MPPYIPSRPHSIISIIGELRSSANTYAYQAETIRKQTNDYRSANLMMGQSLGLKQAISFLQLLVPDPNDGIVPVGAGQQGPSGRYQNPFGTSPFGPAFQEERWDPNGQRTVVVGDGGQPKEAMPAPIGAIATQVFCPDCNRPVFLSPDTMNEFSNASVWCTDCNKSFNVSIAENEDQPSFFQLTPCVTCGKMVEVTAPTEELLNAISPNEVWCDEHIPQEQEQEEPISVQCQKCGKPVPMSQSEFDAIVQPGPGPGAVTTTVLCDECLKSGN